MSAFSSHQLSEIVNAINTRSALQQVGLRQTALNQTASTSRLQASFESQTRRPVFDLSGKPFSSTLLGLERFHLLTLPPDISLGTVVEYSDHDHVHRALVAPPPRSNHTRGIFLHPLSQKDFQQLTVSKPNTPIFTLHVSDFLPPNRNQRLLLSLLSRIDPTETIFFKILVGSLISRSWDLDSAQEVFILIYLRLLFIAALISLTLFFVFSFFSKLFPF